MPLFKAISQVEAVELDEKGRPIINRTDMGPYMEDLQTIGINNSVWYEVPASEAKDIDRNYHTAASRLGWSVRTETRASENAGFVNLRVVPTDKREYLSYVQFGRDLGLLAGRSKRTTDNLVEVANKTKTEQAAEMAKASIATTTAAWQARDGWKAIFEAWPAVRDEDDTPESQAFKRKTMLEYAATLTDPAVIKAATPSIEKAKAETLTAAAQGNGAGQSPVTETVQAAEGPQPEQSAEEPQPARGRASKQA
jgi:hypothetical protein